MNSACHKNLDFYEIFQSTVVDSATGHAAIEINISEMPFVEHQLEAKRRYKIDFSSSVDDLTRRRAAVPAAGG